MGCFVHPVPNPQGYFNQLNLLLVLKLIYYNFDACKSSGNRDIRFFISSLDII